MVLRTDSSCDALGGSSYDGVLKIDGEVGNKKFYDPRSYLKKAEASMTERVVEACNDLHSSGRSVSAG